MRRLVWPGVAWLLVAVAPGLTAQRAGTPTAPRLEEPRPAPALPVALVPFSVPQAWCQGGGQPSVTLRVFDFLITPVRVLRLRGRNGQLLDGSPLRCGAHVAFWDGTVGDPPRLPIPAVYYVQLQVEREGRRTELATIKLVVPLN